jgi:type IV pilus assembly protein PilY1
MLQQQTIDHELTVSGKKVRVTSDHQFSYTPGTGNNPKGWYMDLVFPANSATGERVTSRALLRQDRVIFTTMIPSTEPCSYGGTSWIMELDALTGARLAYSAFDINDDKAMNTQDFVEVTVNGNVVKVPVSAIKIESGMVKPAAVIARGSVEHKIVSTTSGEIASILEKRGARPGVIPRTSWCEIGSGC